MFRAAGSRLFLTAVLTLSLLTLLVPPAVADLVSNNVAGSAGSKVLTVARGATAAVAYSVEGTNDDPGGDANGCNPAGTSATLATAFSTGSGVTATSVVFTGCGQAQTSVITVSPTASLGDRAAVFTMTGGKPGSKWNMTDARFTLRVVAAVNTAPVLSLPAGAGAEATGPGGAAVTYAVSASDVQDGNLTSAVTCSPASGATFPLGATTVACSVTDAGGLSATGTFSVTVRDTSAPSLNVVAPLTAEATSAAGAVVTYTATATDAADPAPSVSCAPASGATFPLGATAVACTATDASGNAGSAGFTVTVQDTGAPTLGATSNLTLEATGPAGAAGNFTVTATDGASTPAVSCSDGVNLPYAGEAGTFSGQFPLGDTTVTCTARDASGNTSTGSFTVTVADTTEPVLTMPVVGTSEAASPLGAEVGFTATASDLVDGAVTVVCDPAPGSVFPIGSTPVACTATDAAGNIGSAGFSVTVADTTPPVFGELPVALGGEAASPDGALIGYVISAADAASAVTVACTDGGGGAVSATGQIFPLGVTEVTCVATDGAGLTSTAVFDVTVVDTTAPELTVPSGMTLEATGPSGATAQFTVSAHDAADREPALTCDAASGASFGLGDTTVTCTATDASGNSSAPGSFTITVEDTSAPVVTAPGNAEAEATGPAGATVTYADATADDTVDGALAATCAPASGSVFGLGVTTVTCAATDAAGNRGEAGFVVTVNDTTAPDVLAPEDVVAEATGPSGAAVTYGAATASDSVDGPLPATCSPASGSTFTLGVNPVTCQATDAHGNVGYGGLSVTVADTTRPEVTPPADVTAEATSSAGAVVTYGSASSTDAVDGAPGAACLPASGSSFAMGATTVTCSATDAAGNTGTATFTVTVADTAAPVVTPPASATAEATGPDGAAVSFGAASATDAVDGTTAAACDQDTGAMFPLGQTTVTCSVTDAAGNTGSATFTVTVRDTTAPAVSVPAPVTATAVSASGAPVTYTATGTDLVDGVVAAACSTASGATFPLGATTVSCTATDAAGNTSGAQTFTVRVSWAWSGFLQPINNDGTSVFKLGSTIPVKFALSGASAGFAGLNATLLVAKVANGVAGTEAEATSSTPASAGSAFRYDATSAQYIYNYGTKGLTEGTYQVRVELGDGVSRTVRFSLRR